MWIPRGIGRALLRQSRVSITLQCAPGSVDVSVGVAFFRAPVRQPSTFKLQGQAAAPDPAHMAKAVARSSVSSGSPRRGARSRQAQPLL
ncbi:hypothetical protein NDU88_004318 [Pleurodeles waltl]|uniref:Uncharacterized protein n=1 Tax=Pleurodeles waltl TaxID=8319 RepID=A0AAV7KXI4_PLEWA|nr:hypothetical protein NDU88_004318 [Pleurodeles waltl]